MEASGKHSSAWFLARIIYSSTLKMKATCSSKTLAEFQRTTWRYIPEDRSLHDHRRENPKSCMQGNATIVI
jgi:hypothetical protein